MEKSQKPEPDDGGAIFEYETRPKELHHQDLTEEKLAQLLEFIGELQQHPEGAAELKLRINRYGKCDRMEGETTAQFYGRLRSWLDKDLPLTKSSRHAPSENGC